MAQVFRWVYTANGGIDVDLPVPVLRMSALSSASVKSSRLAVFLCGLYAVAFPSNSVSENANNDLAWSRIG